MTESTPPTPPPDQGWSAPTTPDPAAPAAPAEPYATQPTATAVVVERPGTVTAGAVTLIVLGAITLLIGLFALLAGAIFAGASGAINEAGEVPAGFEGMFGVFAGAIVVIAILVLAWGAAEIWVAIKAMAGRNWARTAGIVLSAVGGILSLLGAFGEGGVQILNLIFAAAYAFVIYAFWTAGSWFKARSA